MRHPAFSHKFALSHQLGRLFYAILMSEHVFFGRLPHLFSKGGTDMGDETKIQAREVKKGAAAMGSIVERYMIRLLGPLGRKIQEATPLGRAMALIGITAIAVSLVLIFANALSFSFRTEAAKGALVVSKPVANLRAKPSTKAKVVAKAEKGETVSSIDSTEGWYKVRAQAGTGWISKDMVARRGNKANKAVVITYEMKGYGIVFLAGLALFIAGIVQKQKGR
jgi:hypothetical protein